MTILFHARTAEARGGREDLPSEIEAPAGENLLAPPSLQRAVTFPLADWIDSHEECRHNLGLSGMRGTVRHPIPTRSEVRTASGTELREALADDLGVDPARVFLTPGASDGNAKVLVYLARRSRGPARTCRVRYPEYPPLFDTARWAGFRLDPARGRGSATVAIVSNPRNPEGNRWSENELLDWSEGARALLVDETFREFGGTPSVHRLSRTGVWTTGTFTKFFAGDDLRVGFVVAPEEEQAAFAEYHGLVADQLANYSVAGALATLRDRNRLRREVRAVLDRNLAALRRAFPLAELPAAPVFFDRSPRDGGHCAERALSASVLVCPGRFFGDASGVRICLTRRSLPADLNAYVRVRGPPRLDG
jgi:histidinol-phosphate/aromatic aminotransferase/cobyric acid decarboxylase-like protein